jgi:hypothetical protein
LAPGGWLRYFFEGLPRNRVLRVEAQRRSQVRFRFVGLALFEQDKAEVTVGFGIGGVESDDGGKFLGGLAKRPRAGFLVLLFGKQARALLKFPRSQTALLLEITA